MAHACAAIGSAAAETARTNENRLDAMVTLMKVRSWKYAPGKYRSRWYTDAYGRHLWHIAHGSRRMSGLRHCNWPGAPNLRDELSHRAVCIEGGNVRRMVACCNQASNSVANLSNGVDPRISGGQPPRTRRKARQGNLCMMAPRLPPCPHVPHVPPRQPRHPPCTARSRGRCLPTRNRSTAGRAAVPARIL